MKHTRHSGTPGLLAASIVSVMLLGAQSAHAQMAAGGRSPIYLEDSPDATDLLAKAYEFVQASRMAEAAGVYQTLMQDYGRKLTSVATGKGAVGPERAVLPSDIRVFVSRELANNAALLEAYQRLYEGEAAAQLAAAMEGKQVDAAEPAPDQPPAPTPAGIRINIGALERVYRKYWLCSSGLESGLRLAGLSLARGAVADAMAVLDTLGSHPLLSTQITRYQQLQAAAGIFGGDAARLKNAKQALTDRKEEQALAQLAMWESNARPVAVNGPLLTSLVQVIDPPLSTTQPVDPQAKPRTTVPTNLSTPLWSLTIADVASRDAMARARGMPTAVAKGSPTLPVVDGDRLLINLGDDVLAIERNSGRKLWTARRSNPVVGSDAAMNLRMQSPLAAPTQPRGVAVEGSYRTGAVMTAVVGMPNFLPMQWGVMAGMPAATVVMGINAADGKVLWEVSPGSIDETLEQGAFVGTPAMFGGRTYVLLRRAQMQGLQHTVAVALDSTTGRLLWKRSLASANYLNGPLGAAYLNVSGGRIFVGDSLGTTVCLDCFDGTIRWLNASGGKSMNEWAEGRRFGGGGRPTPGAGPSHEPIFIDAGILIPAGGTDETGNQVSALVLDPETGRTKGGFPDSILKDSLWGEAEYVTKIGSDLLVVGATVARLDGRTLAIKWSRRLDAIKNSKLAGAPAVTSDMVIIPTADSVLALQLDGGKIAADAEVESPGNLLLLAGQLICVNDREVRGFLDWKIAYERLKGQIERDGKTAASLSAALTLSQLASAANQREAMIEGADLALACAAALPTGVASTKALQREVFEQLLSLADTERYIDVTTRRALFERVAAASQGPADEVVYRISFARRLAGGKFVEDAIDQYQGVLIDSALSSQLYERGGDSRQAGLEARMQIGKLIAAGGPAVYAKYDTLASQRLAELSAPGVPRDPSALVELARQMPYAKVVPAALLAAGEAMLTSGNSAEAVPQLRRAYAMNREAELFPRLAGAMVSAYVANKQPRLALVWLMRLKREHAEVEPIRAGKPITLDAWIAELSAQSRGEDLLPGLELPLGNPIAIPGQLLVPSTQSEDSWPSDRLVVQRGAAVMLFGGAKLEQQWKIDVPSEDAAELSLLSHTRQSCVFYLPSSRMLRVIDANSGRELWTTKTADDLLAEAGTAADRRKAATPEQRKFMAEVNQWNFVFRNGKAVTPRDLLNAAGPALFAKCNEQVVVVADHLGRVVGLDRATGRVLWKLLCPFDRLEFLEISGETLALAGQTAFTSEASTGNILIIDPLTGETRKTVEDKDVPQWVAVSEDGRLLVATATQLLCRSPENGEIAWRLQMPEQTLTNVMRVQGDMLLARVTTGEILVIDTGSGQIVNRFANTESTTTQDGLVMRGAQDNWHVLTSTTATMLDSQGKVRWRDAVRPEEKHFISQLVGDKYVTLVAVTLRLGTSVSLVPGSDLPVGGPAVTAANEAARAIRDGVVRERLRVQNGPAAPAAPAPMGNSVAAWGFKLFFLDRQTGKIVAEQAIAPMGVPLRPNGAMMLNHRLVLSTSNAVIVMPDATIK